MSLSAQSVNTGAAMVGRDPEGQRVIWDKILDGHEATQDFWKMMEGDGMHFPIHRVKDTSKGAGSKVRFTAKAGFGNVPIPGSERVNNRFEAIKTKTHELEVDSLRHASELENRTEEVMGIEGLLADGVPQMQSEWLGGIKSDHLEFMFLHNGSDYNRIVHHNKRNIDSLRPSDTLDYETVTRAGQILKTRGGKAAHVGSYKNKQSIRAFCGVATSDQMLSLQLDQDWLEATQTADKRGDGQFIFSGEYQKIQGHTLHERLYIDGHDKNTAIGGPLAPKAVLMDAVIDAAPGTKLTGGGSYNDFNDLAWYTRYFPNCPYRINSRQTLPVDLAAEFFVVVVNSANGDSDDSNQDADKWGMYSYSVNDGNRLTIKNALTPDSTLGNVKWDPNQNTNSHPADSEFYIVNSSAVPFQSMIMLGHCAARRGYGKYDKDFSTELEEGNKFKEFYLESTFGQEPRLDTNGKAQGYIVLDVAVEHGAKITPSLIVENY